MFQADMCKQPLLVIQTCIASFDRMFLAADAQSTTMGFISLNTQSFLLHNWNTPPTTGYKPQENQWLYGLLNGTEPPEDEKINELVYLGGTGPYETGTPMKHMNETELNKYFSLPQRWGNIFHDNYLMGTQPVFVTNKSPAEIISYTKTTGRPPGIPQLTDNTTIKDSTIFTRKSTANTIQCRYNPFNDKGVGNKIFLVSNNTDRGPWSEPTDPKLVREDLPLWLLPFGWLDWQNKLNHVSAVDTSYMTLIESPYISPPQKYYLVLDEDFQTGTSPYSETLFDSDKKHWYPKNRYQAQTLNNIACCGPGIIKLQNQQSCEAHMLYKFHFKFGGCPPPMEKICSPAAQPTYPIPNSKHATTSLQSPTTPIQTYLYSFDERRGLLTEKAAKRIKKDYETQKTIMPFTKATSTDLPPPRQETQTSDSETSEEEEEIHLQLQQLRRKQKRLKQRILNLLTQQSLE